MELHQLRYFVTVADKGGFTRAAEACFVSQPSLSQQIIKLERELGHRLFDRLGRTVKLTEAGHAAYAHAISILRSVDEIEDSVIAATDPEKGAITVGAIPTIAPYLMPALIKRFAKTYPESVISIHEDLTAETERRCAVGEIDIGIIATPPANSALRSQELFTEEMLLALPANHRLANKKRIGLEDVAGEPFVLMNELHCLGEQVVGFCHKQGCLPVVRCVGVQLLTIQQLVALGRGVSLIPAMAAQSDKRCAYRSLTAPKPQRTIRMIWHKDRYQSQLVRAFLEVLAGCGKL